MAHDLIQTVDKLKGDSQSFVLGTTNWRAFNSETELNWDKVEFSQESKQNIPTTSGIYAFVVEHSNSHFPQHGFIMYIGQTSKLDRRFGEYLREAKGGGRATIEYMLSKWSKDMKFHFAEIYGDNKLLCKIEKNLNNALMPPFVTNDFSAEVRRALSVL